MAWSRGPGTGKGSGVGRRSVPQLLLRGRSACRRESQIRIDPPWARQERQEHGATHRAGSRRCCLESAGAWRSTSRHLRRWPEPRRRSAHLVPFGPEGGRIRWSRRPGAGKAPGPCLGRGCLVAFRARATWAHPQSAPIGGRDTPQVTVPLLRALLGALIRHEGPSSVAGGGRSLGRSSSGWVGRGNIGQGVGGQSEREATRGGRTTSSRWGWSWSNSDNAASRSKSGRSSGGSTRVGRNSFGAPRYW